MASGNPLWGPQSKAVATTKAWSLGTSATQGRGQGAAPQHFSQTEEGSNKWARREAPGGICTVYSPSLPSPLSEAQTGHYKASVWGWGSQGHHMLISQDKNALSPKERYQRQRK